MITAQPLNLEFENLVDCLFTHLKMNSFVPNRRWIKATLLEMELIDPYEFTSRLSDLKNPVAAFEQAYKAFEVFYIDYISRLGRRTV